MKIKAISKSEQGGNETLAKSYLVSSVYADEKEIMRSTVTKKDTKDGLMIKITYAFNGEKYHHVKEFII